MAVAAHVRRRHRLFFAQLEATETIVFLTEARPDTSRADARFSDVVLVVCPNVTIRRRLREIDPREGEASLYRTRDLVPAHLMAGLVKGPVLITDWHVFEAPPHVLFPQIGRIVDQYLRDRVEPIPPADLLDVFLSPYCGWVVERLAEAIRPGAARGEAAELPRYEVRHPRGRPRARSSLAYVPSSGRSLTPPRPGPRLGAPSRGARHAVSPVPAREPGPGAGLHDMRDWPDAQLCQVQYPPSG